MRTLHRAALAGVLSLPVVGCTEELAPIVLDISKNCSEAQVDVLVTDVGRVAGSSAVDELVQAAADGSETTSVWALLVPASDGTRNLQVVHYAAGTERSRVDLPIPASEKLNVRLVSAPSSDEVYALRAGPGTFRIWRVIERDPVPFVQDSAELAEFPADTHTCSPCDTTNWYRDLVFVGGQPFLVSVPPFSPTVAISVWVSSLTSSPPDTGPFEIGDQQRLNFEPTCDANQSVADLQTCQDMNAGMSYPSVRVLARQDDPRPPTTAILSMRKRVDAVLPDTMDTTDTTTYDVFVVHVGLDMDGVPQGILRSEQSEGDPTAPPGAPSGLVVDEFATYAMVTMTAEGTRVLRLAHATFEEGFKELNVDLHDGDRLMQLDDDLAIGRIDDGGLFINKVFPDSVDQSHSMRYESTAPIVDFEGGGPGVFTLRRQDALPELIRVACKAPTTQPGQ